jgi:hypothetical protein
MKKAFILFFILIPSLIAAQESVNKHSISILAGNAGHIKEVNDDALHDFPLSGNLLKMKESMLLLNLNYEFSKGIYPWGGKFGYSENKTASKDTQLDLYFRKLELDISSILTPKGLFLIPSIGLGFTKHSFNVAPKIKIEAPYGDSFGLLGNYRCYPHGRERKINFYCSYNLQILNQKRVLSSAIEERILIENTVGYGVDLKIFNEIYLTNEIGYGILNRWIKNESNAYQKKIFQTEIFKIGLKAEFN